MPTMDQTLNEQYMELLKRLGDRLERLSADSAYAHQASGLRGTYLRNIEYLESGTQVNQPDLDCLIELGFEILRKAAEEIGAK